MSLLFSHQGMSDSLRPLGLQHARLHCPSPSPRVCPNSCPFRSVMPSNHLILCHPLLLLPSIFTSITVFSNESALHIRWPKYWISASASVLPMSIQGWFPLGLTGLILQSKGFSTVFSSTTVWKHQFFGALPSLWSNSHICTWLLEKTIVLTIWTFVGKVMSAFYYTV